MRRLHRTAAIAVALTAGLVIPALVLAQGGGAEAAAERTRGRIVDLAGSWANRLHEDWIERAPGPHIGDYAGLPINDEARAYADLYQVSMQNMPERQCILYTSQYIVMGPQNLRIEPEYDPISGDVVALHMTGTVDRAPRTIWLDGRSHPSAHAPHTPGGFSTGVWEGSTLTVQTTHLKAGLVWRNGVPHSDQATMTEHWIRHGDLLTAVMVLYDPIYWEEPFIRSATFEHDPETRVLPEPCEPQVEIPRAPGEIPHYLPGENPYLTEFAESLNLPLAAVRGGSETLLPEYGRQLRGIYQPPAQCPFYCCGGTGQTAEGVRDSSCKVLDEN
jgi:hypothetical protein